MKAEEGFQNNRGFPESEMEQESLTYSVRAMTVALEDYRVENTFFPVAWQPRGLLTFSREPVLGLKATKAQLLLGCLLHVQWWCWWSWPMKWLSLCCLEHILLTSSDLLGALSIFFFSCLFTNLLLFPLCPNRCFCPLSWRFSEAWWKEMKDCPMLQHDASPLHWFCHITELPHLPLLLAMGKSPVLGTQWGCLKCGETAAGYLRKK